MSTNHNFGYFGWKQIHLNSAFFALILIGCASSIYGIQEIRYQQQRHLAISLAEDLNTTKSELSTTNTKIQELREFERNKNSELQDIELKLEASNGKIKAYEAEIQSLTQEHTQLNRQLGQVRTEARFMSQCIADVQPFLEHAQAVQSGFRSSSVSFFRRLAFESPSAVQDLNNFMDSWKYGSCSKAEPILKNYR